MGGREFLNSPPSPRTPLHSRQHCQHDGNCEAHLGSAGETDTVTHHTGSDMQQDTGHCVQMWRHDQYDVRTGQDGN